MQRSREFMGLAEQEEAAPLANNTAPGDQQPLANTTFAGKKGLVVDGSQNLRGIGAVRTPFGR